MIASFSVFVKNIISKGDFSFIDRDFNYLEQPPLFGRLRSNGISRQRGNSDRFRYASMDLAAQIRRSQIFRRVAEGIDIRPLLHLRGKITSPFIQQRDVNFQLWMVIGAGNCAQGTVKGKNPAHCERGFRQKGISKEILYLWRGAPTGIRIPV
jgi:hypothetical protein